MKKIFFLLLMSMIFIGQSKSVLAEDRNYPLVAEGQYFSVYAFPGINYQEFLEKINYDNFFQIQMLNSEQDSPRELMAKTLDAIYLEVSDALGINVYSFKGNIKVFPDQPSLNTEYVMLFQKDFPERAFYLHEKATLYVSLEDLDIGMLVHEMSHMIISNYFIVPPSAKLQEILSGYAEYHFKKRLNLLPVAKKTF